MEPAGLALGVVGLAGSLTKVSIDFYKIFSQIPDVGESHDAILHDLRTEALRLMEWEKFWRLDTGTSGQGQLLDPTDHRYPYALAGLARIVAGFAKVAELQLKYSGQQTRPGTPQSSRSHTRKRDRLKTWFDTSSRSKSPRPAPGPGTTDDPSQSSTPCLDMSQLSLLENPRCLTDPTAVLGLDQEIASLRQAAKNVQQSISAYRKLSWVVYDMAKLNELIDRLKKYIDGLHSVLPPHTQVSLPHKQVGLCFDIPFKPPSIQSDASYVERKEVLKQLREQIEQGTGKGGVNQVALYGIGGTGKTQLALDYVRRHKSDYSSVFWVTSATIESIRLGFTHMMEQLVQFHARISDAGAPNYAQIGGLLGMAGKLDECGKFRAETSTEQQHVIEAVKEWLSMNGNSRWLLIFDNVDDLETFQINDYIPSCFHGTLIITSRRPQILQGRRGFEVRQMEVMEAEMLLIQSSHREYEEIPQEERELERQAVAAIIQKFENLPLAIDQAGAYIHLQQCSFQDYLKEIEANISFHLRKGWKLGDGNGNRSVFAAWELSFEAMSRRDPKAAELFLLCGFLDNHDISEELLRRGMGLQKDDDSLANSIRTLFSFSLAKRKFSSSFTIHPLVHVWSHSKLQDGSYTTKFQEALRMIVSSLNSSSFDIKEKKQEDWAFERLLIPHIVFIRGRMLDHEMDNAQTTMLFRMATICYDHGQYNKSLEWYQLALTAEEKQLGPDHLETLSTVQDMANLYRDLGQYDKALEWYQRALAGMEKQLGPDNLNTLQTVQNMAGLYDDLGQYDKGLEWYQRALAGTEKQLGPDHLDTLHMVHNLAILYKKLGQYDKALEWYQRALAGMEKQLGPDHLTTLTTVHNMASLYKGLGQYDKALEWYQRALAGRDKQLGPDHLNTLSTVHDMASLYDDLGQYDKALEWYQRVLAGREKQLGPDHLNTLTAVQNMATLYRNLGQYDKALEWYQRALAGRETQLGPDHFSTLTAVHNMANLYDDLGQYDKALEWYQRALAGMEKQLGPDHLTTLTTVHNMASLYEDLGQYDEALEWYQRVLAGREKQLGPDHLDTLSTVHNMASLYDNLGQCGKALEWYQRALAGREKQLGPDHLSTLTTVHNMASLYDNLGQYDKALEWYQRVLAGREKQLGPDHLDTLSTVHNLAILYKNLEQYDKALEWYQRALAGREKQLGTYHPKTQNTIYGLISAHLRLSLSSDDTTGNLAKGKDKATWRFLSAFALAVVIYITQLGYYLLDRMWRLLQFFS